MASSVCLQPFHDFADLTYQRLGISTRALPVGLFLDRFVGLSGDLLCLLQACFENLLRTVANFVAIGAKLLILCGCVGQHHPDGSAQRETDCGDSQRFALEEVLCRLAHPEPLYRWRLSRAGRQFLSSSPWRPLQRLPQLRPRRLLPMKPNRRYREHRPIPDASLPLAEIRLLAARVGKRVTIPPFR